MASNVRVLAVAAALLGALALPPAALSQLWPNKMRNAGLARGDMSIAGETARSLYESGSARVGQRRDWTNPATGSFGTTTLASEQTVRGMPCRTIRYDFHMIKPDRENTYSVQWCRTPEGAWKTVE